MAVVAHRHGWLPNEWCRLWAYECAYVVTLPAQVTYNSKWRSTRPQPCSGAVAVQCSTCLMRLQRSPLITITMTLTLVDIITMVPSTYAPRTLCKQFLRRKKKHIPYSSSKNVPIYTTNNRSRGINFCVKTEGDIFEGHGQIWPEQAPNLKLEQQSPEYVCGMYIS